MLQHSLLTIFLVFTALTATSCSMLRPAPTLNPLSQEVANTLQPGLVPHYFEKFFARNVGELPDDTSTRLKSWQGEPILHIDNQFGSGEVFGSGLNRGIGIRMRGALYFSSVGTYTFQALSNDGVKVFLGDAVVVNDPIQHSDQLSGEKTLHITQKGWYPVRIDYFQRKGTAALKLFWKTPESDTMTIIPASAYGHIGPIPAQ